MRPHLKIVRFKCTQNIVTLNLMPLVLYVKVRDIMYLTYIHSIYSFTTASLNSRTLDLLVDEQNVYYNNSYRAGSVVTTNDHQQFGFVGSFPNFNMEEASTSF